MDEFFYNPSDSVYACDKCGSLDIQSRHWLKVNGGEYMGEDESENSVWCPVCHKLIWWNDLIETTKGELNEVYNE
jgi:hypothetical protein